MTQEQQKIGSLLGTHASFSGKLTFEGSIRIEGAFEGEVFSDDTLVVAEGGRVKGAVKVGHLVVTGGIVEAEVNARESVEILPGGRLVGNIITPLLHIEKGAFFSGTSTMPEPSPDPAPPAAETE